MSQPLARRRPDRAFPFSSTFSTPPAVLGRRNHPLNCILPMHKRRKANDTNQSLGFVSPVRAATRPDHGTRLSDRAPSAALLLPSQVSRTSSCWSSPPFPGRRGRAGFDSCLPSFQSRACTTTLTSIRTQEREGLRFLLSSFFLTGGLSCCCRMEHDFLIQLLPSSNTLASLLESPASLFLFFSSTKYVHCTSHACYSYMTPL